MLLELLKEVVASNEQLTNEIQELTATVKKKDDAIDNMSTEIQKRGEKIAVDILKTAFTPGQVKSLVSRSSSRVRLRVFNRW